MDPDTITAIAACFIAALALGFTIWRACASDNQTRLLYKPHLFFRERYMPDEQLVGLFLINDGQGPAIVGDSQLTVDGGSFHYSKNTGWNDALKALGIEERLPVYGWKPAGNYVTAGEKFLVFGMSTEHDTVENRICVRKAIHRLGISFKYKSIFDEPDEVSWDSDLFADSTAPTKSAKL